MADEIWTVTGARPARILKALPDGSTIAEGLIIPYTVDRLGEFFSPRTRLNSGEYQDARGQTFAVSDFPIFHDHNWERFTKGITFGRAIPGSEREDQWGRWVEFQLFQAVEYDERQQEMDALAAARSMRELIDGGVVGMSSSTSESAGAFINAETGEIMRWPVFEGSLTTIPANPDTRGVTIVKSEVARGRRMPHTDSAPTLEPAAGPADKAAPPAGNKAAAVDDELALQRERYRLLAL